MLDMQWDSRSPGSPQREAAVYILRRRSDLLAYAFRPIPHGRPLDEIP
jgi:hypothetical protein